MHKTYISCYSVGSQIAYKKFSKTSVVTEKTTFANLFMIIITVIDNYILKGILTCCFFSLPIHIWETQIPKYLLQMLAVFLFFYPLTSISAFSLPSRQHFCPVKHQITAAQHQRFLSSKRFLTFEQRSTAQYYQRTEQSVILIHNLLHLNNLRPLRVSQKNVLISCVRVSRILLHHNCMQQS